MNTTLMYRHNFTFQNYSLNYIQLSITTPLHPPLPIKKNKLYRYIKHLKFNSKQLLKKSKVLHPILLQYICTFPLKLPMKYLFVCTAYYACK